MSGPPDVRAGLLVSKGYLVALADGMGGHAAGAVASQTAIAAVRNRYYATPGGDIPSALRAAVEEANSAVRAQAENDPSYQGMGSTLVAAVLRGNALHVANVGDSRAYLVRGAAITQLTLDHSWVAEELRAGVLSAEEAQAHPLSHIITRSLGSKADVQVDLFEAPIGPGDSVILCSDGLWGAVGDQEITQVVSRLSPQSAADELVSLANSRAAKDNISVLVVSVADEPPGAPPRVWNRGLLGAVLIGFAVVGLTFALALPRKGFVPPTPTATAIMLGSQRTTSSPTRSADAAAQRPTPAPSSTPLPTRTATPVGYTAPRFQVNDRVRIVQGTEWVLLLRVPEGAPGAVAFGDEELTVIFQPRRVRWCRPSALPRVGLLTLLPQLDCDLRTWWLVGKSGEQPARGWVPEELLEHELQGQ